MSKDVEKVKDKDESKKLADLNPIQRDRFIKAEIGKKIKQNEISKIRGMTISQVNQIADKSVDPPMDESRLNRIRLMNQSIGVTDDMLEHSIKTPGEKHVELLEKSEALRRKKRIQFRKDPIMSQIKRGKLGMDNFFILFGIFGSLMIPVYIFNKFKKNREAIVNSRIASPEVIKRLDEDSPISLDDVSYHTIHYYNPDRAKQEEAKKYIRQERERLERELYF